MSQRSTFSDGKRNLRQGVVGNTVSITGNSVNLSDEKRGGKIKKAAPNHGVAFLGKEKRYFIKTIFLVATNDAPALSTGVAKNLIK